MKDEGTLAGGGVVTCCACGNDSAVASLTGRLSLDIPAIAGLVSRVYRRNCVRSGNGLRAASNEHPYVCNLGPRSKCFVNISVGGFSVGVKVVGFGKSVIRLGESVPCGCRKATRTLSRVYGVVGSFVEGSEIGARGVVGMYIAVSNQIGPRSKCDFDMFGFSRGPLTRAVSRGVNCTSYVSGSAEAVACKRFFRKRTGNGGGIVFVGTD